MPSDLAISRAAARRPLEEVAADMGIGPHLLEPYGSTASKISLDAIDELRDRPRAKDAVIRDRPRVLVHAFEPPGAVSASLFAARRREPVGA